MNFFLVRDMADEFEISHLGAHGDGVARDGGGGGAGDGDIFIPYTLPGELVNAKRDGSWAVLDKILKPSDQRVKAVCRHFTRCGGCKLQHMQLDQYNEWKVARVRDALSRQGIECAFEPVWSAGMGARRRAVFSASRTKKTVQFGFIHYRGGLIENVTECPILVPEIEMHLDDLRRLAGHFLTRKREAKLAVTACLDGLDVRIDGARGELAADIIGRISGDCEAARVQRLIVDGEILYQNGEPEVLLSGVRVRMPIIGFLQACENAEIRMADIITAGLSGCKSVLDLFAGVGTFSFALARDVSVLAVENSGSSLGALRVGFEGSKNIKPISVLNRDLFLDPMSAKELEKFDGVVFDPPRAGAEAQAKQLAKSDVGNVYAVSCNPITLGRDLKVMLDGGYTIKSVHPIDQFVYSAHVEVLVHLVR